MMITRHICHPAEAGRKIKWKDYAGNTQEAWYEHCECGNTRHVKDGVPDSWCCREPNHGYKFSEEDSRVDL